MIRLILYLLVGFIVWRVVMFFFRAMTKPSGQPGSGHQQKTRSRPTQDKMEFKDVRDAEFVEVSEKEPQQK